MRGSALVTGASGGLGSAISRVLAGAGFDTVVHYHRGRDRAERLANEIGAKSIVGADLSKPEGAAVVVGHVEAELGRLDVLVNCAGISEEALLLKTGPDIYDRIIHANLYSSFYITREAARVMGRGGGHIINISSHAAFTGRKGLSAYSAAKAALTGFSLSAARELAGIGIRVNVILPGYLLTPMGLSSSEGARDGAIAGHIMGKFGNAASVAGFTVWLVGTDHITGQVFNLDGRPI